MKNKYFDNYDEYLSLQVSKVGDYLSKDAAIGIEKEYFQGTRIRKAFWASSLSDLMPPGNDVNVLILGARWGSDVLFLKEAGYSSVTAIDLYDPPLSDLVLTGDAHYLSEMVKSPVSVVWAHHVFEHFFKPSKVMEELSKVITEGAYMYIGIPFASRNKYDAQDEFSTPEEFCELMKRFSFHPVMFRENKRGKHKTKIYHFYIFRHGDQNAVIDREIGKL